MGWDIAFVVLSVLAVANLARLPEYWHRPRPSRNTPPGFDGDQQARVLPALTVFLAVELPSTTIRGWLDETPADGFAGPVETWLLLAAFALLASLTWLGRPFFLVPPKMRGKERTRQLHHATITSIGSADPDDRDRYSVSCDCDWIGEWTETEAQARAIAHEHAGNVTGP